MPFLKGKPKIGGRTKQSKNKATILKEKVGLNNWDGLTSYIETDGAAKLIREMKKLKGKDYVTAFGGLAEFVKPKLARTVLSGPNDNPVKISSVIDYSKLSDAALQEIINATSIKSSFRELTI
ncbi:MAG: hypothetical protein JWM28_3867 [Chitinophagaceae bacterium]|nr:hypothetical protein [Chitinophagaceae bacterium]